MSRNDSAGALADGASAVAHDLNNVLTVITGSVALAERHAEGNARLLRLLNNIRVAADRGSELASRLYQLAGHEQGAAPPEAEAEKNQPPAAGGSPDVGSRSRVLVVEDDPDVAEIAVAVIESLGLAVEACTEAESAFRRVEERPDFDLVFSDIVMPGSMNGIELAERLHARFPDLPVLLATGYSTAALAPGGLRFPVLAKPYSVQELSRRIAQMIAVD